MYSLLLPVYIDIIFILELFLLTCVFLYIFYINNIAER